MSEISAGALLLGLSRTGITLLRTRGWMRARVEFVAEVACTTQEMSSGEGLLAPLRRVFSEAGRRRARVKVVLSDDWARSWMVTPPRNASRLSDCQSAAQARFQVLYGDTTADWHITADWDSRRTFLACAVPNYLSMGLKQAAREQALILQEVAPQFVVAWNRWRAQLAADAWFGVMREQAITLAALDRHGIAAVRELKLPAGGPIDQSMLPRLLSQEALRQNVPAPSELRLCGQIPSHWVMQQVEKLKFIRLDQIRADQGLPASAGVALALTGFAQ